MNHDEIKSNNAIEDEVTGTEEFQTGENRESIQDSAEQGSAGTAEEGETGGSEIIENQVMEDGAQTPSDEETPENRIEDLKDEVRQITATLQRERADFVNFRRRTQAEKQESKNEAVKSILTEMLPVLDTFDQMFSVQVDVKEQKIDQFLDGMKLIRKQLWQSFSNLGVEELDPSGKEFDPNVMEALSVQESEDVKHEIVHQVYQKGYSLNGQVLRPSRVGVNKPAAKEDKKGN